MLYEVETFWNPLHINLYRFLAHTVSTLLNDISSKATGPIGPKLYLWHSWAGELKVCVFYEQILLSLLAMAT